jgi:hypothetical protein
MSLFSNLFQFVCGCRHLHLSRVFTIKRRTYRVCFDCGLEFDIPSAPVPKRSNPVLQAEASAHRVVSIEH